LISFTWLKVGASEMQIDYFEGCGSNHAFSFARSFYVEGFSSEIWAKTFSQSRNLNKKGFISKPPELK
jgi:hypothetical protein